LGGGDAKARALAIKARCTREVGYRVLYERLRVARVAADAFADHEQLLLSAAEIPEPPFHRRDLTAWLGWEDSNSEMLLYTALGRTPWFSRTFSY
jgi:hypothetical protein